MGLGADSATVVDGSAGTSTSRGARASVRRRGEVASAPDVVGAVRPVRPDGSRRGFRRVVGASLPDDELDEDESESDEGPAHAIPGLPAIAAPTPSAAASTPTRPMYPA
jgi:hypothetical protein